MKKTLILALTLVVTTQAYAFTNNGFSESGSSNSNDSSNDSSISWSIKYVTSSESYKENRPTLARQAMQKLMEEPKSRIYDGEFQLLKQFLDEAKAKLGSRYNEDLIFRIVIRDYRESLKD